MASEPLLVLQDVTTSFPGENGPLNAVDHVSWHVNQQEAVAIVGESGSGKTVTCLSVIHLVTDNGTATTTGSIRFDGREMTTMPLRELRKIRGQEIGMVFQEPMTSLNPVLTIRKQMDETLKAHSSMGAAERRARMLELMTLVGIPEPEKRLRCYPFELSGGMRQRVMIAMALLLRPKLLIADEPTTALDVTIQAQILTLLKDLKDKLSMSVLLISHDLGVVANFAQRVIVMYAGRICEEGPTREVLKNPLHWYTRGLIASIPRANQDKDAPLHVIEGTVPDLSDMPKGCRFAPRCERAQERCRQEAPLMCDFGGGRRAACFYPCQEGDDEK